MHDADRAEYLSKTSTKTIKVYMLLKLQTL
jgi:hypothetical protein